MPFSVYLRSPCLLSTESPRSSSIIKSFFRRHFSKKHSIHRQQSSTRRLQHTKGSNIVQEISLSDKSHSISKTSNNYDMTILHDDELNSTQLAVHRRRKKKIPTWAKKEQLQLAIINQVYFQDNNPDDIFGHICMDQAFEMMNSIQFDNKTATSMIVSRHFR